LGTSSSAGAWIDPGTLARLTQVAHMLSGDPARSGSNSPSLWSTQNRFMLRMELQSSAQDRVNAPHTPTRSVSSSPTRRPAARPTAPTSSRSKRRHGARMDGQWIAPCSLPPRAFFSSTSPSSPASRARRPLDRHQPEQRPKRPRRRSQRPPVTQRKL